MRRYLLLRLGQGIISLLIMSILIFFLARLTGNPLDVLLPENATLAEYELMSEYLKLDEPFYKQYWSFLTKAIKGDFGDSLRYRTPVRDFIIRRAPATFSLAGVAFLVSILIALPAGVIAASQKDKWQDIIAKLFAIFGQSLPTFWLGIMLIQLFAVRLGWLPAGMYNRGIQYWILPALSLGWHSTAGILRLTRSEMLDVLSSDYVRLAKIKGLSTPVVIWKHALRNALIPVVTFLSNIYGRFLMGSVVTEVVFSWPGLGRLAYEAIMHRDFPMVQGLVIIFVGLFILINLITDILYIYLDPRIRYVIE